MRAGRGMTEQRKPDLTTTWFIEDQKRSGLTLGEYERQHGIILEELPLPSPATQRIRRGETKKGASRRTNTERAPQSPQGTMSPEMSAARRAYYEGERLVGSPIACVGCGGWITNDVTRTDLLCDGCAFLADEAGGAFTAS